MSMKHRKIMIVDDIEANVFLLKSLLSNYQLCEAYSGQECLNSVESECPDLILLDVSMPYMDGYEVCKLLRSKAETAEIPIIFVSAQTSPEDRLLGYESGGDDYIVKPVAKEKLLLSVERYLRIATENVELKERTQLAVNTALDAMTFNSEVGQLIEFIKTVAESKSLGGIAGNMMICANQFGINSCILIRDDDKDNYFGCLDNTVEAKVLSKCLSSGEHIVNLGPRSIFCEGNIGILAINMPLSDPLTYGRLKDHLMVLCNLASQLSTAVILRGNAKRQREEASVAFFGKFENSLKTITDYAVQHDNNIYQCMQSLMLKIEARVSYLGLEEDQENALSQLVENTSSELYDAGTMAENLEPILNSLMTDAQNLIE